jgi:hypothetical protein
VIHHIALGNVIMMRLARDAFAQVVAGVIAAIADRDSAAADGG